MSDMAFMSASVSYQCIEVYLLSLDEGLKHHDGCRREVHTIERFSFEACHVSRATKASLASLFPKGADI